MLPLINLSLGSFNCIIDSLNRGWVPFSRTRSVNRLVAWRKYVQIS
jgi:hypothetical protein